MFLINPPSPEMVGTGQNNPEAVRQIFNMPGMQEHLRRIGTRLQQMPQPPQPGFPDPSQPPQQAQPGLDPMMLVNALRGPQ
jgi:hypothetical protein